MDVTIKDIPSGISAEQIMEWVSIFVKRYEEQKVNEIPEIKLAVETMKTTVDSFRKANALKELYKVEEVVKEVVEPVVQK